MPISTQKLNALATIYGCYVKNGVDGRSSKGNYKGYKTEYDNIAKEFIDNNLLQLIEDSDDGNICNTIENYPDLEELVGNTTDEELNQVAKAIQACNPDELVLSGSSKKSSSKKRPRTQEPMKYPMKYPVDPWRYVGGDFIPAVGSSSFFSDSNKVQKTGDKRDTDVKGLPRFDNP
jgi:hypothetical protein